MVPSVLLICFGQQALLPQTKVVQVGVDFSVARFGCISSVLVHEDNVLDDDVHAYLHGVHVVDELHLLEHGQQEQVQLVPARVLFYQVSIDEHCRFDLVYLLGYLRINHKIVLLIVRQSTSNETMVVVGQRGVVAPGFTTILDELGIVGVSINRESSFQLVLDVPFPLTWVERLEMG